MTSMRRLRSRHCNLLSILILSLYIYSICYAESAIPLKGRGANLTSDRDFIAKSSRPLPEHDLSLDDLPPCKQDSKRVLAAITLGGFGDTDRQLILVRQLDFYVQLCEEGFEVHVVLVTYSRSFMDNHAGIYSKTRYVCDRVEAAIPIVPWVQMEPLLSAYHRRLFIMMSMRYDWFVSQEDDMVITPRHFNYFVKWSQRFEGTKLYPGFAITEIPTNLYNISELYKEAPRVWMPFTYAHERHLYLFQQNGSTHFAHMKPWVPAYFLSRNMLLRIANETSWNNRTDETVHRIEPNVHFQHLWLAREYLVVRPLEDISSSWMFHSPNRYSNLEMHERLEKNLTQDRQISVHVDEFAAILANCTGQDFASNRSGVHPWNLEKITYMNGKNPIISPDAPCKKCIAEGKAASIYMTFPGHYIRRSLDRRTSSVVVSIKCESIMGIKQEVAGCHPDGPPCKRPGEVEAKAKKSPSSQSLGTYVYNIFSSFFN